MTYNRMRPDLVITDLVMPKMDGLRLIAELMAMNASVRIIAVSGKGPEQLERAKAAGALVALAKPFRRDAAGSRDRESPRGAGARGLGRLGAGPAPSPWPNVVA
ncbi:MAG: response regulator [Gemmatimonadetes bacterium]|nr:response regulator [Gemmatimonadota bacterium]